MEKEESAAMRNRILSSTFAAIAVFALAPVLFAQINKQTPDMSGVWLIKRGGSMEMGQVPLTPWAEAKYKYNVDPEAPGGRRGRIELDPRGAHCFPPSVNFLMSYGDPFQFVHVSPNQVMLAYEYDHWLRQIWIGEEHPKDLDLSWMGNSVGKWEGDTLAVDTISMRSEPWFDTAGRVFSTDLHIVERFRRANHELLEVEFTFEDPQAFLRPWTVKKEYELKPDWKLLERVYCDDRFREGIYHGQGGL